ncbi:uncharacterized protein LOC133726569 [Rosa rugosa]|uniref:uncharacterized protein LOC133726569 n=1 Tax=Rosa rugosa TaxID=74645 RepID=UPI002B404220|nr:uncharacterized protein LOC133726569 [Rosa rugosa]
MSSRDSMKFEDFNIYTSLLSNIRHLVLLAGHPHLQTTVQEVAYIPAALHQMDLIPAKPNGLYPYRHFPLPRPNCHQVPRALAFTTPEKHLHQWQDAYRRVCVNRRVHIAQSIASAGKEFHEVYNYHSSFKTAGYNDHDPIDELQYFSNVIKHLDNETVYSSHDMFPYNTMEMFKFHWCYDRHAMETINLENIQQQDRL